MMNIPTVSVWKAANGIFMEYFLETFAGNSSFNKCLCAAEEGILSCLYCTSPHFFSPFFICIFLCTASPLLSLSAFASMLQSGFRKNDNLKLTSLIVVQTVLEHSYRSYLTCRLFLFPCSSVDLWNSHMI